MNAVATPAPPLLVGLVGRAGAGKNTVAAILEAEFAFLPLAFADPLRAMLGGLLDQVGVEADWMAERALKELPLPVLGFSYRHLVQTLGTEWGRGLRPDFWLRIAEHRIAQAQLQGDSVVITDVRFPNEAAWLQQRGAVLVRIEREGLGPVREHESEHHVAALPAHHVIRNHGSRLALFDQVDQLMVQLRPPLRQE